jgi:hypothetical protein
MGKEKKNNANEECQLVLSFLAIFEDPICGNGQQNVAFWECIVDLQQTSFLKVHSDLHKV